MIVIENNNDNNSDDDNSDDDENNDNNDDSNDNKLPADSPHKGPTMLSFDVTFVESKNKSSFRWFETPCPSSNVTVMCYICTAPPYMYCWKQ